MKCPKCGALLETFDRFCGDCGAPAESNAAAKGDRQDLGTISRLSFYRNGNTIWASRPSGSKAIGEFTQNGQRIGITIYGSRSGEPASELTGELARFAQADRWVQA